MHFDTVVIGSGIGGLTAAAKLAQDNFGVLLLEASDDFGGYIRPFEMEDYTFDVGLHYLGHLEPEGMFRELLQRLDMEDLSFLELDPKGFDRYVFPDYEFRFGKGKEALKEKLVHDFPLEVKGIDKWLDLLRKTKQALRPEKIATGHLYKWISHMLANPIMLKYGNKTYQHVLQQITSDPKLQAVLSAPLFDCALGARNASALIGLGIWSYYLEGAYYPVGGSKALRNRFLEKLNRKGVSLIHSNPVVSISRGHGEWMVLTKKGDEFTCRTVISTINPKETICGLLKGERVPKRVHRKACNMVPSASIISVFVGTDLDLPAMGIGSENICDFPSWEIEEGYQEWLCSPLPGANPGLFINSPSVRDPQSRYAPDQHHALQILGGGNFTGFERWATMDPNQRGSDYLALKKRIEHQFIRRAERYIPSLSDHVTFVYSFTPLDCHDRVFTERGAIYGPAETPEQIGPGRFPSLEGGIPGLFLAGSGTLVASVFHSSMSGFLAAEKAIDFLKLSHK